MNINFVLPDGITLGGVTTWSIEMCRHLAAQQQSVSLIEHITFNPSFPVDLPDKVMRVNCQDGVHPDSPFIKAPEIKAFISQYQKVLPGIIIPNWSNGTYAICAAIAAQHSDQLRVIGYVHTDEPLYYDWLTYYEPIIHQFVCVSQEIAAKLQERLPHRADDMVIKPYAVVVSPKLARTYSPSDKPLQLIYAGRIAQRQKRIFDLVKLVECLAQRKVNFQLRIIGNGDEQAPLAQKLAMLDPSIQQCITQEAGKRPDEMADIWRMADIFISVSEYEGTSIAMLEAMAQGCVPVVTEVSGTKAVINDDHNGHLVKIGDIDHMARIIQTLDKHRDKVSQMGVAAHATVIERYTYDDYVTWFLGLSQSLWQQPDRIWPNDKPIIPPGLGAIKRDDIMGTLSGDPASFRILQHKILHASRLAGFYYALRYKLDRLKQSTSHHT